MTVMPVQTQDFETPTLADFETRVRQDIDDLPDNLSWLISLRRRTGQFSLVSRVKDLPASNCIEGDRGPGRTRCGRRRRPAGRLQ